jgi:hypothetical protein
MRTSKKRKDAAQDSSDGTVKTAAHPFDFQEDGLSDVVLRSSDGVDFFVHMVTLSVSSSVFGGLFRIPTPAITSPDRDDIRDGLPVVRLSETSRTLDSVLRFIYPIPPPDDLKFQEVADVLSAVDKYCLTGILHRVQPLLASLLDDDPVGVYAISVANKIYDLARDAALQTLEIPIEKLSSPNIEYIPTKDHTRLLKYHFDVDLDMQKFVCGTSWFSTLQGLYKKPTNNLCRSCYNSETYPEWVIHRSFELLIQHCERARFFYLDTLDLNDIYDKISPYYFCRTCNRGCAEIETNKFIKLLQSAVAEKLEQVRIFAAGSGII